MARNDGRYRIEDEPARSPLRGAAPSPFWLLPITLYLGLAYSIFFLLLPGLLGFLIGGWHRWRDPALAVLSIGIFIAGGLAIYFCVQAGLDGLLLGFAHDLRIAFTALPLFLIAHGQIRTLALRAVASR